MEITSSCYQEHEKNGDASSDNDSLSLLCNLNATVGREAAEDMEICSLDSQVGYKEQKKEMQMEINQPLESELSSFTQSAGYGNSISQFGNQKFKNLQNILNDIVMMPQ